ncbi:hypothetical protein PMI02_01745 [Novosphingobium sp. AP12]|nr:hypothetical protein PMI02_01745 [Novosphingobium sp. AP12]
MGQFSMEIYTPPGSLLSAINRQGDPRTIFCTVIAVQRKQTKRVRLQFDASAATIDMGFCGALRN